jgi:hypothetical protein
MRRQWSFVIACVLATTVFACSGSDPGRSSSGQENTDDDEQESDAGRGTADSGSHPTCTSFTYSAFGECQANGTQTRKVVSSSPAGCTGGSPVLSQSCKATTPPAIDGAALYKQYCSGCHGDAKKGRSVTAIQGAISANRGGMSSLSFLTAEQLAAISAAP